MEIPPRNFCTSPSTATVHFSWSAIQLPLLPHNGNRRGVGVAAAGGDWRSLLANTCYAVPKSGKQIHNSLTQEAINVHHRRAINKAIGPTTTAPPDEWTPRQHLQVRGRTMKETEWTIEVTLQFSFCSIQLTSAALFAFALSILQQGGRRSFSCSCCRSRGETGEE